MATKEPSKDDQPNKGKKEVTRKSKICTTCKGRHYTKTDLCYTCKNKEIQKQINDTGGKKCTKCQNVHTETTVTCPDCNKKAEIYRNKKKEENADENLKGKCTWNDRYDMPCISKKVENTEYCKLHQYVEKYTKEEKEQSVICSGCRKKKYCGTTIFGVPKTRCEKCMKRQNDIKKEEYKQMPKCSGNAATGANCIFKALENEQYCGKHITHANYLKHAKETNTKLCKFIGHYNDCEKYISNDSIFVTCEYCRKQEQKTHGGKKNKKN